MSPTTCIGLLLAITVTLLPHTMDASFPVGIARRDPLEGQTIVTNHAYRYQRLGADEVLHFGLTATPAHPSDPVWFNPFRVHPYQELAIEKKRDWLRPISPPALPAT